MGLADDFLIRTSTCAALTMYRDKSRDVRFYFIALLTAFVSLSGCEKQADSFQLGTRYYLQNDLDQAEYHYLRALEEYRREQPPNDYMIGKTHSRLGSIYLVTGKTDNAETHLLLAVEALIRSNSDYLYELAKTYLSLGILYGNVNRFEASELYLHSALETAVKVGNKNLVAACYEEMGDLYSETAEYELAERNYGLAMAIYANLGMRSEAASVDKKRTLLPNE